MAHSRGVVGAVLGSANTKLTQSPPRFSNTPIVGSAVVGSATSFTQATVTGNPAPTRTVEWLLDDAPIGGATGATYTPVSGNVGNNRLKVRETATNAAGSATVTSAAVTVVSVPAVTTAPSINGSPAVGSSASYTPGTYTGFPTPTVTARQWLRSGSAIAGATAATYTPVSADAGTNTLSIRETASNSAGSVQSTSAAVSVSAGSVSALDADWAFRGTIGQNGVWLAQNFNTQASVTNNTWPDDTASKVVWERLVKRSGNGSCRFNRGREAGTGAGLIKLPFDLTNGANQNHVSTVTMGVGTENWYQGTFFMSESLMRWKATYAGGQTGSFAGGIKLLWISGGGNNSNVPGEVVTLDGYMNGYVTAYYTNAGGSFLDWQTNFPTPNNSSNVRFWPAVDAGTPVTDDASACRRYGLLRQINDPGYQASMYGPVSGDTWAQGYPNPDIAASGVSAIPPDGWFTIGLRIKRLTTSSAEIQVWTGRPGDTPTCIINNLATLGPTEHGAIWIGCYDTARDQNSPGLADAYMLVTELIASSQPIPWPAVPDCRPAWKTNILDVQPRLTWVSIPNTNIATISNPTPPAGFNVNGVKNKIDAWVSFGFDQRTCDWYQAAGGGHGDWSGNEVDRIRLADDAPAWANLRPYTSPVQVEVNRYADGRPTSRHTYQGIFFNELRGRVMLTGGAGFGSGAGVSVTEGFNPDPSVMDWDFVSGGPVYPTIPNSTAIQNHGVAMDPKHFDLYDPCSFQHYRWNNKENTITTLSTNAPTWAERAGTAFDTKRRRFFQVGGDNFKSCNLYNVDTNTYSVPVLTGPMATFVRDQQQSALEYIPRLDCYILCANDTVGVAGRPLILIRINASTFECTQLATTVVGTMPPPVWYILKRFVYSKKLDCCLCYPAYNGDVWAIRLPAS